jgi:hypothetical protein
VTDLVPFDPSDYGCICRDGMDPFGPSLGSALDEVDRACAIWKRCHRCVRDEHQCLNHVQLKYSMKERNGEKVCSNKSGSCKRVSCECDLQFATALESLLPNPEYQGDAFDADSQCERHGGGSEPLCCLNQNLYVFYNAKSHCCESGVVYPIGQCF